MTTCSLNSFIPIICQGISDRRSLLSYLAMYRQIPKSFLFSMFPFYFTFLPSRKVFWIWIKVIQILAVCGLCGNGILMFAIPMNPRPLLPHNLHQSTMVLTRQSILTQSSRVSTRSTYGMQFFVLENNGSYSHSSNCHCCYGEVRILVSQPFFISFSSIVQTFSSNLFIFYAECSFKAIVSRLSSTSVNESKTVQLKSKTVSHSKKSCSIPATPHFSELYVRYTSIGCDANYNLGSPTNSSHSISIPDSDKFSHYQHPCNNLLTNVLLWANYHRAEDGIALPFTGYLIINQSLMSILVTIKQLYSNSTSTLVIYYKH